VIAAVDTNILLDYLIPGSAAAEDSRLALLRVLEVGTAVISEPVLAELSPAFGSRRELGDFLVQNSLRLVPSGASVLYDAGHAWRQYRSRSRGIACSTCGAAARPQCERCGTPIRTRQHILADFIIGAHALAHADALLTRDRGYYATYFPKLRLI
jgi:predicted nucleic acid-binding protein